MSMSEFKESLPGENGPEQPLSHLSIHGQSLPDDFSEEDVAFAHELESLLVPEQEQIPPYYVQTLLDSEDQRFQAVEPGFEKKVSARVFRRLKLRRRLYRSHRSPLQAMIKTLSLSRSLLIAACLLFMFLTMLMTGPAFAAGLSVLLSAGKHSGVMLVRSYPTIASDANHQNRSSGADIVAKPTHISLLDAQNRMNFHIYWPTADTLPSSYALHRIYLYQGVYQDWADGPILELNYQYASPGVTPLDPGRGKLSIYEFKPVGKVFQVVMSGAAHQVKISIQGQEDAIYVDGQWMRVNRNYQWRYGERSELIYEHDGVIFWIAGDQRDGIDSNALLSIASSLHALDVSHISHSRGYSNDVTPSDNGSPELFAGDIIYINDEDGPSLIVGGELKNTVGVN